MPVGDNVAIDARKIEPPRGPNTSRGFGNGDSVSSDGSFVIWGLDRGTYLFEGWRKGAEWASAPVEVTVARKDVDGVAIRMLRELDISGQVVFGDGRSHAVVAGDGSFHLTRVKPGRYFVRLSFAAYVQSMQLGSAKSDGAILDLRDGAALTVTASSVMGQVAGMVSNAYGPVAHARVALLEDGVRFATPSIISTRADGTYSFFNTWPGKYQLMVLDDGVARALDLRDQLSDYAAVAIELHAGERITRDLRLRDPNSR
jgi:hypothetical protein